MNLDKHHLEQLNKSGISKEVIESRGYHSVTNKAELAGLGFTTNQQRVPGLLIPLWGVDGKPAGHQFRPDNPRLNNKNKLIKYENPTGSNIRLDCPPRCQKMLADLQMPLWITEGSKKADSLASQGLCAISLNGVWGFMGKNATGATTFLADWDYVALKDRTVYLAFDSDVSTKPPVRKAMFRLAEHLHPLGAKINIVTLPQGNGKVGVDDYLVAGHSVTDLKNLSLPWKYVKRTEDKEKTIQACHRTVGEKLYLQVKKSEGDYAFAYIDDTDHIKLTEEIIVTGNTTVRPRPLPIKDGATIEFVGMPDENIVNTKLITPEELYQLLKSHLLKYVDLSDLDLDLCIYYILFTGFYPKVNTLGYLRFMADTGKGKSRILTAVGDICFYPMHASGASSFSGIARQQDIWHGTLVVDESDFAGDKEHQLLKYINLGFERGKYYVLTDKQNPREQEIFDPFCPKIFAMREPFRDNATEGRIFSVSPHETNNRSIPIILPQEYYAEMMHIRNTIAVFTLHHWNEVDGSKMVSFNDLDIEPRLKQLTMPLSIIFQFWPDGIQKFRDYILRRQIEIKKTRALSWEGTLVNLVISISTGDVDLQEAFADYYLSQKGIQAITPSMITSQLKTSAKSATQVLQSVGFEVEWRWIITNKPGAKNKKRTRAYCIPDANTWREIIQRYYYSEDEKFIEMPPVLMASKYFEGVQKCVPSVPSVPMEFTTDHFGTDGTDGTVLSTQLQHSDSNLLLETTDMEEEGWENL